MSVDVPPLCRRHLELLAAVIKSARANMDPLAGDRFTAHWTNLISRGSKSFDREKFLRSCGVRALPESST